VTHFILRNGVVRNSIHGVASFAQYKVLKNNNMTSLNLLTQSIQQFQQEQSKAITTLTRCLNEDITNRDTSISVKEEQLRQREAELAEREEKLQAMIEQLQLMNDTTQQKVKLNIGGQVYATTVSTLTAEENTLFTAMFSEKYKVEPDVDGEYFIDRNGAHFAIILEHLRGAREIDSELNEYSNVQLSTLLLESEFYGINSLTNKIKRIVQTRRVSNKRARVECEIPIISGPVTNSLSLFSNYTTTVSIDELLDLRPVTPLYRHFVL
jgi:hypothetical protein